MVLDNRMVQDETTVQDKPMVLDKRVMPDNRMMLGRKNQKQSPNLMLKLIARWSLVLPSQCQSSKPWWYLVSEG